MYIYKNFGANEHIIKLTESDIDLLSEMYDAGQIYLFAKFILNKLKEDDSED